MKILDVKTEDRRLGDFGEGEAVKHLKRSGYKILERNYVAFDHEVDIIAEFNDAIAFIEVKTRTAGFTNPREPRPASAVTPKKQRAIISAAKVYIAFHPPKKHIRFDIIEVYANQNGRGGWTLHDIKHLKGAFDNNTAHPTPYKR